MGAIELTCKALPAYAQETPIASAQAPSVMNIGAAILACSNRLNNRARMVWH